MDALVLKTMNILNTKDDTLAREIVSEIASILEVELCEDLRQECAFQSKTIDDYVSEVNRLTARVTELELSSGYRTGATETLRGLAVGEKKLFPAGDQYSKLAKRIWNIAKAAGLKTKQRSIQKNGMIYVEVTRIA